MKRVLITAGPVYGRLDANKLVGNRSRGIWALQLADTLAMQGYLDGGDIFWVTLLVSDTFPKERISDYISRVAQPYVTVVRHTGFDDYREKCHQLAQENDYAVMASAVVNWIPKTPFPGKMPTHGYTVGDEISIPFYLAPRVIEEMKAHNPNLTIIGCKMLAGATDEDLIEAAYGVLLKSRCNVVVANDLSRGLRRKLLVYPDRSVHVYEDDWQRFEAALVALLNDKFWSTKLSQDPMEDSVALAHARRLFDQIVDKNRSRFIHPMEGDSRVFGSLAVPVGETAWLVSPREKGGIFTSADAVLVNGISVSDRTVMVQGKTKATLNAPLLVRMSAQYGHRAVLHLHEDHPMGITVPYGPPGTDRDNSRDIPGPRINIEGHGFVAAINDKCG